MANRTNKAKAKHACDSYTFPIDFKFCTLILLHETKNIVSSNKWLQQTRTLAHKHITSFREDDNSVKFRNHNANSAKVPIETERYRRRSNIHGTKTRILETKQSWSNIFPSIKISIWSILMCNPLAILIRISEIRVWHIYSCHWLELRMLMHSVIVSLHNVIDSK